MPAADLGPVAPRSRHAATHRLLVLTLGSLLAVSACTTSSGSDPAQSADPTSTSTSTESQTSTEGSGPATGIPASYAEAFAERREGVRGVPKGGTDVKGVEPSCPLKESIELDDRSIDEQGMTSFTLLDSGSYELQCSFTAKGDVFLLFAQADDKAGFEALKDATGAVEEPNNEQVEDEFTIGRRSITVVTMTFPANPGAVAYMACHLDETMMARACLNVWDGEERDGYDAELAAEDLSANLSA